MKLATSIIIAAAALVLASTAPSASAPRTTRVSVSSNRHQGDRPSYTAGISANGRYVAFTSLATNLVPGDTNERQDAFVYDRRTGRTKRVSLSNTGAQAKQAADPVGGSAALGMSANGRFVAFRSDAPNLVGGDTNRASDVFVRDRKTGRTARVSVSSAGGQGNSNSVAGAISANGRYVVFASYASNLVPHDTNREFDVFIHDRKTGHTERVSVRGAGREANGWSENPAINAKGRYVSFESNASNLVPHDTNRLPDVFVRDLKTGKTTRVSVRSNGEQGTGRKYSNGANGSAISGNGRYVAFHSDMRNLVGGDTNGLFDIFVHDRKTGKTQRVSVSTGGRQANLESLGAPTLSADGRYVAFSSLATNLVAHDANDITDVFVRDLRKNRTTLVSLGAHGQGDDASWVGLGAAFTANSHILVFASWAENLVPGDSNSVADVFVRGFRG